MSAPQQSLLMQAAAAAASDPYFANVTALLHFNGADGSTTITDVIGSTWTAGGTAQIDTAQSQSGGASLSVDGTSGSMVSTPDAAGWTFGSGDFTIEWFVRFFSINVNPASVIVTKRTLFGPYSVQIDSSGVITHLCSNDGSTWGVNIASAASTIGINTWYHGALCRSGTTFSAFHNGTRIGTATMSGSLHVNSDVLSVGALGPGTFGCGAWIDEFRITKGVARYSGSTYTIPTVPFPDS